MSQLKRERIEMSRQLSSYFEPIGRMSYLPAAMFFVLITVERGPLSVFHASDHSVIHLILELGLVTLWICGTMMRMVDLRISPLWTLLYVLPLGMVVMAMRKHWVSASEITMAITYATQLPLVLMRSRRELAVTRVDALNGLRK
jgi:hypothetical protein